MELVTGQIVFSRRGRDNGRVYVVCGQAEERVLLANGQKFTLAAPKRKNTRHINPTQTVLAPDVAGTDAGIKKALAAYAVAITPTSGG